MVLFFFFALVEALDGELDFVGLPVRVGGDEGVGDAGVAELTEETAVTGVEPLLDESEMSENAKSGSVKSRFCCQKSRLTVSVQVFLEGVFIDIPSEKVGKAQAEVAQ